MLDSYSDIWTMSSEIIVQEAKKRWYSVEIIDRERNFFSITHKDTCRYFKSNDAWLDTSLGIKIADSKELTNIIAQRHNLPIPSTYYLNKWEDIVEVLSWKKLLYPLVTKPVNGAHGSWVALWINNYDELLDWIKYSFWYTGVTRIMIQQQILWDDYRIIIINGKFIACSKRTPPYIVWNWKNTISELIDTFNDSIDTKNTYWLKLYNKIIVDQESMHTIVSQGYKLWNILDKGEKIFVRKNANLSTGWFAIDATELVHTSIIDDCVRFSNILWLWVAGIDVMTSDICKPLSETWGAIIEVNNTPWFKMHHYPAIWKPRNVAWALLDSIFTK